MRLISPIVTMDVEIEEARAIGRTLVLNGFAGINDMEVRLDTREAWKLLGLMLHPKIIWAMLKSVFPGKAKHHEINSD